MKELTVHNRLLRALPQEDFVKLSSAMERIQLHAGDRLQGAFEPRVKAIFVESGLLSCFAGEHGRDQTEIAIIGREGMSGLSELMADTGGPFHLVSQKPGEGYTIPITRLRTVCQESPAALSTFLRYSYALQVQIAETGRANARQTVEARLARWLLMAHDRIDGSEIELTHENLSVILGVRRPGITVALHVLEGERMIKARRGAIEIIDRTKLERSANGSYGLSEREYERVLGEAQPQRATA